MINPKYLSTAEEPMLRELLRHFSIVVDPDLRERYLLVGALVVHLAEMEAAGLTSPAEYAAKLKSDEARKAARERMQRYRDKLRGKKPVTHVREQASPYAVTQTSEHTPQGYVTHVREQASPHVVMPTNEPLPPEMAETYEPDDDELEREERYNELLAQGMDPAEAANLAHGITQ
ncbi:MAG TPA: hypothetical protein VKQ30_20765 [Ktedonobacterales bacterium]|nr:hypothetical protein [Ktedonobacterales bacterium]